MKDRADPSEEQLLALLRQAAASEREPPPRHRLETEACPSAPQLVHAAEEGFAAFGEAERAHIAGCDYCQLTLRVALDAECPSLPVLGEFAAAGSPAESALLAHLEQGRCGCGKRLAVLSRLRSLKAAFGRISVRLELALPALEPELPLAGRARLAGAFAGAEAPGRFRVTFEEPGGTSATLYADDAGIAHLELLSADPAFRHGAEALLASETAAPEHWLSLSLPTSDWPGGRLHAEESLGRPLAAIHDALGAELELVVAPEVGLTRFG